MPRRSADFPGVEWVDGAGDFITVDGARCNGCLSCINVCVARCFERADKVVRVRSLEECMECGACWFACTAGAIGFSWPGAGTGYRSAWG